MQKTRSGERVPMEKLPTREQVYAAGRMAQRTGRAREDNPWQRHPGERTTEVDFLCGAWYAGYDFEVC